MQYTRNGLVIFGQYLHMVRGSKSLRDFAGMTGLSHTTISLLERAKHIPDWATIKKLSPYVGLKLEQITVMINETDCSKRNEVIELLSRLDADEKIKIVLSLAQDLSNDKRLEIIKGLSKQKTAE